MYAHAVALYVTQSGRLRLVTKKWIYPGMAKRYGTDWKSVEQRRLALEELAGRALPKRPYAAQMLAILSCSPLSPYVEALAVHGLGKTVTFPGKSDNVGVVDQAVNEGGRAIVPKGRVPLAEFQIGGNDQAFPLIVVRDRLEKQFGGILVERDRANFINGESFCLPQSSKECVACFFMIPLPRQVR